MGRRSWAMTVIRLLALPGVSTALWREMFLIDAQFVRLWVVKMAPVRATNSKQNNQPTEAQKALQFTRIIHQDVTV